MTAAGQVPRREPRARAQNGRVERPVRIQCSVCQRDWDCSARYARNIRRGEYQAVCPACKHPTRGGIVVTETMRRYWRRRWTEQEIVACARMIWGLDLDAPPLEDMLPEDTELAA